MRIRSVAHRGLRRFIERNDTSGLSPGAVERIRAIVSFLQDMDGVEELQDMPGWRPHTLKGDRKGTWSLTVTGNWRITFEMTQNPNEIVKLNYEDYHE